MTCIGGLLDTVTGSVILTADEIKEVEGHIDQLNDENAKLREYAQVMHFHIKECCDACGERGICDVDALTRELRIEVG